MRRQDKYAPSQPSCFCSWWGGRREPAHGCPRYHADDESEAIDRAWEAWREGHDAQFFVRPFDE